jgi:hypothetical protein
MPLSASDITNRRKGLVLSYDAYNNQRRANPQAFTTYTETYDGLAAGQKIAVNQQPTGSYICSIPVTAFQEMCATNGSSPTLSELVKATNVQSVIEQAPAAGLNVVVFSGGIAVYCSGGNLIGAVDSAGNPVVYPPVPDIIGSFTFIVRASSGSSQVSNFTITVGA